MFGPRYYGPRYYGPRYYGSGGTPSDPPETGGYYDRHRRQGRGNVMGGGFMAWLLLILGL